MPFLRLCNIKCFFVVAFCADMKCLKRLLEIQLFCSYDIMHLNENRFRQSMSILRISAYQRKVNRDCCQMTDNKSTSNMTLCHTEAF